MHYFAQRNLAVDFANSFSLFNPRAEAHFQIHLRLIQLVAGDLARETSQQCLDVLRFVSWASRRVNIEFFNGLPIACSRFVSVEIRA